MAKRGKSLKKRAEFRKAMRGEFSSLAALESHALLLAAGASSTTRTSDHTGWRWRGRLAPFSPRILGSYAVVVAVTILVQDPDLTIHVGDVRDVLPTLPDESVDCVVTSPPYLDARPEYPSPTEHDFENIFRALRRVVTGPLLVNAGRIFRDGREIRWWVDLLVAAELAGWFHIDTDVWCKPNANPIRGSVLSDSHEYIFLLGDRYTEFNDDAIRRPHAESTKARFGRAWVNHRGVKNPRETRARKTRVAPNPLGARPRSYFETPVGREKGNPHPAPMALEVAKRMVSLASWPGGTVLDPFAGSGTTAIAARLLGRRSILVELNEEYARMAAERCSQLSLLAESSA